MRNLIYQPPKTKRFPLPTLCLGDRVEIRTAYCYSPNSTEYATVIGINGSIGYIVEFANGTRRYIASSEGYRVRKV